MHCNMWHLPDNTDSFVHVNFWPCLRGIRSVQSTTGFPLPEAAPLSPEAGCRRDSRACWPWRSSFPQSPSPMPQGTFPAGSQSHQWPVPAGKIIGCIAFFCKCLIYFSSYAAWISGKSVSPKGSASAWIFCKSSHVSGSLRKFFFPGVFGA